MPRETRAQRRQQAHEDSVLDVRPRDPRRPAPSLSAQAQQALRYRAGRRTARVRFDTPGPESGTRSGAIRDTPQAEDSDSGAVPPSIEEGENPAAGEEWTQSLVIGSSLGDDLSAIQLADRKIGQWRAILRHHQETLPGSVSPIQGMLDEVIAERAQLDDTVANRTPKSVLQSTARDAINDRLALLRSALEESTFPPEAANIRAAIAGYTGGLIPYSAAYTLIYAGHIVDTCPSYESFSSGADRTARLDMYEAVHGPGWLWYEPPLAGGGGRETVKRACALTNPPSRRATANGGHWEITMGFRRRIAWVSRGSGAKTAVAGSKKRSRANDGSGDDDDKDGKVAKKGTSSSSRVVAGKSDARMMSDPTAPTLYFSMHLDSGASKPSLYEADFRAIGIDPSKYAAQSVVWAQAVFGGVKLKMFEIDVGIYGDDNASLVSPSPPSRVWPAEPDALGATLPVLMMPGLPPTPSSVNPGNGNRLSGMLPFYAAYVSAVPGTHTIWLGEDRRDVLGAARMPGQMRYHGFETDERSRGWGTKATTEKTPPMRTTTPPSTGHPTWLERDLGAADRVVFEHDIEGEPGTWVRDEDMGMGASVITLNKKVAPGAGGNPSEAPASAVKKTWRIEPRMQAKQARAIRSSTKWAASRVTGAEGVES